MFPSICRWLSLEHAFKAHWRRLESLMTWAVFLIETRVSNPVMRYARGLPNLSQAAAGVLLGQRSLPAPVLVQDQVLRLSTCIPSCVLMLITRPSCFLLPLCQPLLPRNSAGRIDHVPLPRVLWAKSGSQLNHLLKLFKPKVVLNPWQPRGKTGRNLGDHSAE